MQEDGRSFTHLLRHISGRKLTIEQDDALCLIMYSAEEDSTSILCRRELQVPAFNEARPGGYSDKHTTGQ